MSGYIYFIRPVGMDGPIKIGCSDTPTHRLKQLMTWSPFELEIIATAPGDQKLEANLHSCFCDIHMHGEWFKPDARLLDAIDQIRGGAPLHVAVNLGDKRGGIRKGKNRRPMSEITQRRLYYVRRFNVRLRYWAARLGLRHLSVPNDVQAIINRWQGDWRDRDGTGIQPTPAETARLDEFLASLPVGATFHPEERNWDRVEAVTPSMLPANENYGHVPHHGEIA
jgi:hypothetical protein